jgi:predicted glycoside hydrolase/deacetylase ChbG (UPF0249 family)
MAGDRRLIVNADDFGLSEGTNLGIIRSHERGIVTSTSLMVRQPAVASAVAYAMAHPAFSIGLHLDLGEWEWRDGEWFQTYHVVPTSDANAVAAEIEHQLETFHQLLGRAPTHLDSHQHVHQHEPARTAALTAAMRLSVPLRGIAGGVTFCGNFYGHGPKGSAFPEGISVENLLRLLQELPAGTTELSCHPGLDETLDSCYRAERLTEVHALCDPRVRETLQGEDIRLAGF